MEFFNEPIRDLIAKNVDIDKDFRYEQFKVGRSNITFKVFDKENTYVLRRPPYGNKLESAHNMSREYKIIDELSKNNIKVPKPIFLYTEKEVCEDDFYVMEYIDGETIATNIEAEKYSKEDKEKISESFIETISTIHNFDVINSELSDLGKHEGYVECWDDVTGAPLVEKLLRAARGRVMPRISRRALLSTLEVGGG